MDGWSWRNFAVSHRLSAQDHISLFDLDRWYHWDDRRRDLNLRLWYRIRDLEVSQDFFVNDFVSLVVLASW